MIKLAQISSGAHRAQGTNWLGAVVGGCHNMDPSIYSKVRNLGCGGVEEVVDNFQVRSLMQLFQEGWIF